MGVAIPNIVGDQDAKAHFSELLAKVEAGGEVTITKAGLPVARVVPVKKPTTRENRRAAVDRIKQLSAGLTLGGLKIRDLIAEGRR